MFWKEKRIERKLERELAGKLRELANTTDSHQKASIMLEIASLKERSGDWLGALETLLERAKSFSDKETVRILTEYIGRAKAFDPARLFEGLLEVACGVDLSESISLIDLVGHRDRKTAVRLAAECFQILGNTEFAKTAMRLIERDVRENGVEVCRSQIEEYIHFVRKCVAVETEGCHDCLEKALEFARNVLKDLELELEFTIDYVKRLPASAGRTDYINNIIDRCEEFSGAFSGRISEMLDKLDPLLEIEEEIDTLLPLLEFMRKLAREASDNREVSYTEKIFRGADLEQLKSEADELERQAKINPTDIVLWKRIASLFRRIIDLSDDKDQKILYSRKLGALLRDRLNDYEGALRTFEEGIEIDRDDVTLWLVKGMTLEKMAQIEEDFEKSCRLWEKAYDHYLQIAERFEEQEVKLSAIEKCAIIKADKITGIN